MKMKRSWIPQGLLVLALLAAIATPAMADSTTVSYQGVLRDATLSPVADGAYDMIFSIWDDVTAGTKRWGDESHPAVQTANGLFSVYLGSTEPLGNLFQQYGALWLEISADTGTGMETYAPRVALASVPYAQYAPQAGNAQTAANAGNADLLDGLDASAFAGASHVHDGTQITTGTVSTDRLNVGTLSTQVARGNHTHNTLTGPGGSPANAVVVDSAGNVGVGTSTPGRRLEVSGALGFTGAGAIGGQSTGQITRSPRIIRTGVRPGLSGCPVGLGCGGVLMEQTFSLSSTAVVQVTGHAFRPSGSGWAQVCLYVDGGRQMCYRIDTINTSAVLNWGGVLGAGNHTIEVRVEEGDCPSWGCPSDGRFDFLHTLIFE